MNDFIDSILFAIDAESLTDLELIEFDYEDYSYSIKNFYSIKGILQNRDMVSDKIERLTYLFKGHGLDLTVKDSETPVSNILIGITL